MSIKQGNKDFPSQMVESLSRIIKNWETKRILESIKGIVYDPLNHETDLCLFEAALHELEFRNVKLFLF